MRKFGGRKEKVAKSGNQKLKVQISVCRRMNKEVQAYILEVSTNEARIQKMRDDKKDEYDIRKQEEVLQESYMMVPDSKRRLETAISELEKVKNEAAEEEAPDAELITEAQGIIDEYNSSSGAAVTGGGGGKPGGK